MVGLILETLHGHALLRDIEHRSFDPDLRGFVDGDQLQVLQHPRDAVVLLAQRDFDVVEFLNVAKRARDRDQIGGVCVFESAGAQKLFA